VSSLPPPPARDAAPLWREVLERIGDDFGAALGAARARPALAPLEAALQIMQRIEEATIDDPRYIDLLDEAAAKLSATREAAEPGERTAPLTKRLTQLEDAIRACREQSLELIVSLQAQMRGAPARADRKDGGFRASVGLPVLHEVPHAFAETWVEDAEDAEIEAAWEEAQREAAAAEAAPPSDGFEPMAESAGNMSEPSGDLEAELAAIEPLPMEKGAHAHLQRIARDCLEDIGAMGLLRRARGEARWHEGIALFEQRLLENLDALVALGWQGPEPRPDERLDVVAEAQRWAADSAVPDPVRAFARAFVLGCVAGADGVRAAVTALRRSHPLTWDSQMDALALSPSPEVGPAMQRICQDGDPRLSRVALEVLRWRGEADVGTVALLLDHGEPAVRAGAARALGRAPERPAAAQLLAELFDEETDPVVSVAIAQSLCELDPTVGLRALRRVVDAARGGAFEGRVPALVRLLAIAGGAADGDRIAAFFGPHRDVAAAVGWLGSAALGDRWFGWLAEHGADLELRRASADACLRIAGEGSSEAEPTVVHVCELWARRRADFAADKRWRFGKPYAPEASLDELEQPGATGADREAAALELAVLSDGRIRVEPHDWAARQAQVIARARDLLRLERLHRAGSWLAD
jgi:HEAT repeat protein